MSETTNLKLFKHDNPSTNTNEFNVDIALNQNWDKIDSFVGTVNSKILEIQNKNTEQDEKISSMQSEIELIQEKDNVQDTKLAELQAENARLREDLNGLPKGQATAETIYLTDSAEMRFKKFGIGGNSKQETRSGKNLFDNTKTPNQLIGATTTKIDTGVRITSINAGVWTGVVYAIKDLSSYVGKEVRAKTTMTPNGDNIGYLGIGICSSTGDNRTAKGTIKSSGETKFTIPNFTDSNTYLYIALNSNSTGTGVEGSYVDYTNLIITIDNEDTSYEPYGAMPSSDYQSEVKSCGDNINYFDEELELGSIDNTTGENAENNSTIRSKNHIAVLSNQELTISNDKQYSNYIYEYDKDKNFIKYTANNQNPYTFITSSTTKYIKFRTIATSKQNDLTTKFKLEKGKVATPYSPYGQGCINEVICNKNLFDKDKATTKTAWFNADGSITNGGDSKIIENYVKVPNNENITINAKGLQSIALYNKDKEFTKRILTNDTEKYTFKEENVYFIRFQMATSKLNLDSIQIEEGTTATDYIEHKSQTYPIPTQQPMRAVGDIRDTFIKKNGKRFERHWIVKTTLGGTESWSSWNISGQTKTKAYVIRNFYGVIGETNINAGCPYLSDYFLFNENNDYGNDEELLFINENNALGIRIKTENGSDLTTFKNWLSNHNIPVYFISKNPTDIECTPEQNEILDKIEQEAHTYKNVTHIYSTDEVSPVNSIEYIKDIETLINKATTVAE